MAELVDAGQRRGEIAKAKDTLRRGPVVVSQNNGATPATPSDLGIAQQRRPPGRIPENRLHQSPQDATEWGEGSNTPPFPGFPA